MFPFEQVLVVGGTGQTGQNLVRLLKVYSGIKLLATARNVSGLDSELASGVQWNVLDLVNDQGRVQEDLLQIAKSFDRSKKLVVFFAAAFTNVEFCEADPSYCIKVNETNTKLVLDFFIQNYDAKVLFYSTDYVFDGLKGMYSEDDATHALSQYGKSKLVLEKWLLMQAGAIVVRTTGVYDYIPGSKNFLMQMISLWSEGKRTRIPFDQFANPVWAYELAKASIELCSKGMSGVFHVAGGQYLARTDFAKIIAKVFSDKFKFSANLIEEISTSELAQKAKRPLKGGLDCSKLKKTLGWAPRSPEDVFNEFLSRD